MSGADRANGRDEADEASFFARWSKRKQAAGQGEQPVAEASPADVGEAVTHAGPHAPASSVPLDGLPDGSVPPGEPSAPPEETQGELCERLGLPDPDTLQAGDDVSGFMRAGVPEWLRRKALRQLWRLNPILANLDELVDYGEDFTDAATVVANLQTTYQVGKGMLAALTEPEEDEADAVPGGEDEGVDGARDEVENAPGPAAVADAANAPIVAGDGVQDQLAGDGVMVAETTPYAPPTAPFRAPSPSEAPMLAAGDARSNLDEVAHSRRPRAMRFTFADEPTA